MASLEKALFETPYRFQFFQLVRLLERYCEQEYQRLGTADSRRIPVGHDGPPSKEVVRFRSRVSLAFPPNDVDDLVPALDAKKPPQMTVAFMGLAGALGPLPSHYTQLLLEPAYDGRFPLRDFLDLFNHRLISLFYRAWERSHIAVAYERAVCNQQEHDQLTENLFALIGLGDRSRRQWLGLQVQGLLPYAGLIAQRPRSAHCLEQVLSGYFEVPVQVIQFQGRRMTLAEQDYTTLGGQATTGAAHNRLGLNTIIGTSIWDQQAMFRVRVGPVSFQQFCRFLPCGEGDAVQPFIRLTEFLAGPEFDFDVQVVLRRSDVPVLRLGGSKETAARLGWSTWLTSTEWRLDPDDLVISRGAGNCKPGHGDTLATRGES